MDSTSGFANGPSKISVALSDVPSRMKTDKDADSLVDKDGEMHEQQRGR